MKKILLAFVIACCFSQAKAAYLWWQLDNEITLSNGETLIGGSDYAYAYLRVVDKDGEQVLFDVLLSGGAHGSGSDGFDITSLGVYDEKTLDSMDEYSFYYEIYSLSDFENPVAVSSKKTPGSSLHGFVDTGTGPTPSDYWHGDGFAVPEPTSGMMILLGLGLLGLRRRRIKEVA